MFEKFNQLLVQHEICLADVCQTTTSEADIDESRIDWIFADTVLEDMVGDIKEDVYDCAGEVDDFMGDNGDDIVTAWQAGQTA